ncbi:methionine ABC transporter ATP-binding protein [Microbacterium halotolerans]|uniref:methionine ABC transporter ATP-binding protein n=1 Tax=Microbacterium halotolerans TaxID=246613 RepID=UPI000E6AD895|nr:ATP-binding cassette domain-containing protein [Microbacterium halotolerans]
MTLFPRDDEPTEAIVEFAAASRVFGTGEAAAAAVDDVSLEIARGSIFGVIGHSGAGKSTLIRMINGLEAPTSGTVTVDGVDIASLAGGTLRQAQKQTGMIFQQFELLQTITVRDNVAMPLRLDGVKRAEAVRRADEVLEFVGLADKAGAHPADLSGGQKQRVGIARAIIRRPRVLLCDEATSALDPTTTTQIIDLLRRINADFGTTIVVVTHEMDVIKDLCEEVAVMSAGRVVERGSVLDVFVHPRHAVSRAFVGTVIPNELPERVSDRLDQHNLLQLLLLDDQVTAPIISTLIAEIGVGVNILHADMTEVQRHTVGQMVIQLEGDAERLSAARSYLENEVVSVSEVAA